MSYYDLRQIQEFIRNGEYRITMSALQGAHYMGFDEDDICDCILNSLNATHFYKAMPSEQFAGLWQDVYKINYEEHRVYLKLQIGPFREICGYIFQGRYELAQRLSGHGFCMDNSEVIGEKR